MRRLILIPLLIIVAFAAIGGGITYYVYNNYMYYGTDDAQITGPIINISAPAAGTLSSLSVKLGDTVTSGETIGSVLPATGAATGVTPSPINLTSPINGTILQVPAVQGQGVAPGLTLLTITDRSTITVTANIDENVINNIQVGQSVDIHIDAYSDTSFTGHVQQIIQAAASEFSLLPTQDNASGNFTKVGQRIPVVITLDGTGGKDVVPGMSAEVTIYLH